MAVHQLRRRFSDIFSSSIGMCRSKHIAHASPAARVVSSSNDHPVVVCSLLPSRARNPRLADLFSADSDTISSSTICEKFDTDTDKTCFGSEADDGASMSAHHLSPFEYETCHGEFDHNENKFEEEAEAAAADDCFIGLSHSPEYYRKSYTRANRKPPPPQRKCTSGKPSSDSDTLSSYFLERFPESACFNELENARGARRKRRRKKGGQVAALRGGNMEAVEKSSVDPYGDFRRSMLEMIVEKKMNGKEELRGLLMRFLALNSPDHHNIIVLVFVEVLEIVFTNSSPSSK